jgi:hypothetical protein
MRSVVIDVDDKPSDIARALFHELGLSNLGVPEGVGYTPNAGPLASREAGGRESGLNAMGIRA